MIKLIDAHKTLPPKICADTYVPESLCGWGSGGGEDFSSWSQLRSGHLLSIYALFSSLLSFPSNFSRQYNMLGRGKFREGSTIVWEPHLLQPNGNDESRALPCRQIDLSLYLSTSFGHLPSPRTCPRRISTDGRKREVVFRRLCLNKTGEGEEVFREGRC